MKTAGTTSVNLTATSPLDRPADHATCPHCGSAISRIVRKSGTVVWKCGTWHSPNLKITEQSKHCRVNELEEEDKQLRAVADRTPTTADGVHITPDLTIYRKAPDDRGGGFICGSIQAVMEEAALRDCSLQEAANGWWSTTEAAQAVGGEA